MANNYPMKSIVVTYVGGGTASAELDYESTVTIDTSPAARNGYSRTNIPAGVPRSLYGNESIVRIASPELRDVALAGGVVTLTYRGATNRDGGGVIDPPVAPVSVRVDADSYMDVSGPQRIAGGGINGRFTKRLSLANATSVTVT